MLIMNFERANKSSASTIELEGNLINIYLHIVFFF